MGPDGQGHARWRRHCGDTFSYDDQDLLTQVSYGAGGSSTMVWDADQQRQKLTNSGGSTYFVYDPTAGVPAVLVETDGTNETFYVREPGGELIARATGQTRQYYFFDRLGSTIAMGPAVEGNPTDRLFCFYEPEIGRFERRDPTPVSLRCPYVYVETRPVARVDPDGMVAVIPDSGGGLEPCADFTNKECIAACLALDPKKGKKYQLCVAVCTSLKGHTCEQLFQYCLHLLRHRQKKAAEACLLAHDQLCSGK